MLGMTTGADGDLLGLVADRVMTRVYLMTVATGDIGVVVMIATPGHALVIVVAAHADTILLLGGDRGIGAEGDHRFLPPAVMFPHGAVAGFALQVGHGRTFYLGIAMYTVK